MPQSRTQPAFLILLSLLAILCQPLQAADPVQGRYVVYGNGLSQILGEAEFEVWSGGVNRVLNRPEAFTLNCIASSSDVSIAGSFRNLTDGKTDTHDKWPKTFEINAKGMGYSDNSLSLCAFEADLGETMPVERIDVYRSRLLFNEREYKMFGDLGWRYVLVLNESRQIVAWHVWNIYHGDYTKHQGHWAIVPQPATGAPAGRLVPANSMSWLSEAEFIRDFLGKPVADVETAISDEERARLARFQQRNEPEAIRELGEAFFRTVDLERPGMAPVKALVEKGRYAEALEAFKAPFFRTLGVLDKVYNKFEYSWYTDANSRVGMRARDLANCVVADKKTLSVTRFTPGLLPPAQVKMPFQMRPLLLSYVSTGDAQFLRAWEAMTDDWAMGFQDAADADPKNLRDHFVLSGQPVMANLLDLLNASRENPGFLREVSGATLARFLMPMLEEIPVANWRVARKTVFNHIFNSVSQGWSLSQVTADFYAGQRLEQEMRQVMQRMYTLGLYRDGPMIEIGDEGHMQGVASSPSGLFGLMAESPEVRPTWFTPAFETYFLDHLRRSELATFSHIAPDGTGIRTAPRRYVFPAGLNSWGDYPDMGVGRNEYPVVAGVLQRASVAMEPEPRGIADRVYGWGIPAQALTDKDERALSDYRYITQRYHRTPEILSDWLPYAGAWYFRGGWGHEDGMLHMLKQPLRNSLNNGWGNPMYGHLGQERYVNSQTAYRFRDYASPMATILATEIDKQAPCNFDGFIFSGSKQDIFTQGVEKPQSTRWFTNERLDFGEAEYSGLYMNYYWYPPFHDKVPAGSAEWQRDPNAVQGVTTLRQIIQVRPARLFLQIDRIRYAEATEGHANRIPLNLILTEPGPETEKAFSDDQLQIDAKAKTVKTRNPGNPGFTYALFGQDFTFTPYSINGAEYNYFPWRDPEEVDPKRDAMLSNDDRDVGFATLNGPRRATGRGVFANWQATGQTVAMAALYANRPGEEPFRKLEDLSTDSVVGCRATTAKGVVVTLLSARQASATLEVGGVTAEGEALLVVEEPRQAPIVLVLGGRTLALNGQATPLPSADLVFDLVDGALTNAAPILTPLDPPTVGPAENVFTDSTEVTLSTTTPGAVIRYTTETPVSRLDEFKHLAELARAGKISYTVAAERLHIRQEEGEDWTLYTGPFTITEDTLVRARTFRQGDEIVPTLRSAGTEVSLMSYGFFTKKPLKPASGGFFKRYQPGLDYDYLEGRWFALWTYTDQLEAKATGAVDTLLDVAMRQTDGPFAVRYHGYIDVPATGVYTFYGPDEFVNNICEPGYDLRVFVDGEEWDLGQTWHGRGQWSVPLAKGAHRFRVTFADARAKDLENQRVDLWRRFPDPMTTWKGVAPVLEVSGPGLTRQPLPSAWLKRDR